MYDLQASVKYFFFMYKIKHLSMGVFFPIGCSVYLIRYVKDILTALVVSESIGIPCHTKTLSKYIKSYLRKKRLFRRDNSIPHVKFRKIPLQDYREYELTYMLDSRMDGQGKRRSNTSQAEKFVLFLVQ
jgi:hypothetical protein